MTQSVPPRGAFDNVSVPAPVQSAHNHRPDGPMPSRAANGRFLSGNSGGGRPKGARNRLTELLMAAIVEDFASHGAATIAQLREADPATYLRMITALVPRELILQREAQPVPDYADLTEEEFIEILVEQRRRRQVEDALKSV